MYMPCLVVLSSACLVEIAHLHCCLEPECAVEVVDIHSPILSTDHYSLDCSIDVLAGSLNSRSTSA